MLPIVTRSGAQITLGTVAELRITSGPAMLRSENARLSGWVYVDLRGRDLQSAVEEMRDCVAREVKLAAGYFVSWSGQFEYLERAQARLRIVVPVTLLVIFVLLYLTFRRVDEALLILATLPFAVIGDSGSSGCSGTKFRLPPALDSSRLRVSPPSSAS
jgi:Cu(I)/Ag(I) efflux system membrane protein CusA/SilA